MARAVAATALLGSVFLGALSARAQEPQGVSPGADHEADPAPASAQDDDLPAGQEAGPRPTPFDQGRLRFSFGAGGGLYGAHRYFSIALGVSYYLLSGLEVGVDVDQWFGDDPQITKLSPQVRYILYMVAPLSPYAGVFYRHWFFWSGSLHGVDTFGGRAGAVWAMGSSGYLGGGVAYEAVISTCTDTCDVFYPELTFGVSF